MSLHHITQRSMVGEDSCSWPPQIVGIMSRCYNMTFWLMNWHYFLVKKFTKSQTRFEQLWYKLFLLVILQQNYYRKALFMILSCLLKFWLFDTGFLYVSASGYWWWQNNFVLQQKYIRGISGWNFNLEELKSQAALVRITSGFTCQLAILSKKDSLWEKNITSLDVWCDWCPDAILG